MKLQQKATFSKRKYEQKKDSVQLFLVKPLLQVVLK